MKYLEAYKALSIPNSTDQVFEYLIGNLAVSIKYWDYFVNWNKVKRNLSGLEMDLNLLNYLVGKDNMEVAFKELIRKHPSVTRLIPLLVACREKKFTILTDYASGSFSYKNFAFDMKKTINENEINDAYEFAIGTGILDIFKNKALKSVPDYVLGVEVGLDSNGRKSRGGKAMETLVEDFISPICSAHNLKYASQADSAKIKSELGIEVEVEESDRKFDFVINNNGKVVLIETNYYGGGGSKLKATAGEYETLYEFAKANDYLFIWITDGLGWKTAQNPLRKSFEKLDYILNLKMVTSGALEEVLTNG